MDATGQRKIERQIDQASPFDFGLIVKTVKQSTQEQFEQQSEKSLEKLPVLEGIRKYAFDPDVRQILLVGRPGSGKSTTLARLLLEEATSPSDKIPILVELRYWQGSIVELIRSAFKRHNWPIAEAELEALLDQRQLLLLFDGVNELPSDQARSQLTAFRRQYPKVAMIFTTRDLSLGGDLGIEKKLEIQPLTETQMSEFVRSYLGIEQGEQLLRQLKDRLRDLGQTPLLLWILCEVVQQSPESKLPENLGGVFKVFTQSYKLSAVRKHEVAALKGDVRPLSDRRLWDNALQYLAFVMMQGKTDIDFRIVLDRVEAERELTNLFKQEPSSSKTARDCLDDLLNYHLLQLGNNPDQIEFRHQLIQEYYAAEALLAKLDYLSEDQLKGNYLNYLKWTEPIALMLALLEEDEKALAIVQWALDIDLMLGARLAGAVRPALQRRAAGSTMGRARSNFLDLPDWFKLKLLKTIGSKVIADQIAAFLDNIHHHIGDEAYFILLDLAPEAIPEEGRHRKNARKVQQLLKSLPEHLEKEDSPILHSRTLEQLEPRVRVVFEAWKAKTLNFDEIIAELEAMLNIPNIATQRSVIKVLGSLKTQLVVPILLQVAQNPQSLVAGDAVMELSAFKLESLVPKLIEIFERNPNPNVRIDVIYALRAIESEAIIPLIFQAIWDPDVWICRAAAEAFESIDSEEIVPRLIEVFSHPEPHVRRLAAYRIQMLSLKENIEKLLSENYIQILVRELEHPDLWVRWRITFTLWNIATEQVMPLLYSKLRHQNLDIQLCAALVLGKFGCKDAAPGLVQLLKINNLGKHPDPYGISNTAAYALKQVKDKSVGKYLPNLLPLISSQAGEEVLRAISNIQSNCKFYNYRVYERSQAIREQAVQKEEKLKIMSDGSKYNFPNAQKVQIFENVETYHEHNYAAQSDKSKAVAEIHQLLESLEHQYPTVTEAEAKNIIEAEIVNIQTHEPQRWQMLRKELLNRERWFNGGKAALVEATQTLADKLWLNVLVAFLDGFSADV